ncbi:hypothetical protein GF351_01805 [Candidatus Woesearchaeota archaeon]|nr:hypothetical protein [Candidatus Woesearchaeota archaeon]
MLPTPIGGEIVSFISKDVLTKDMNIELLEEIGLTRSEIKVYLALLELGSSSTGKIVDKSKVASSKIYEILDKLIQKGLVSFIIKSGVKHFEASPPERIMDYIQEKENKFAKQKKNLKDMLPELELKRRLSHYKSEATVFKGLKGAKTAYDDVLKTMRKGEEYYVIGSGEAYPSILRFFKNYHKKRSAKGVRVKLLFSEKGREWADNMKNMPLTEIRFASAQMLASSFILIYKEKTLISVVAQEDITLFRIDNKEVANSFRSQFEQLWNQDTRILKGINAIQDLFEDMLNHKEVDFIGARGYFVDKRPKFIDRWEKEAKKKGFRMRNIVDPGVKGHRITNFSFAQTRYTLPKEFSELSVFWIFGNKVAISNWVGKEPIVVIIENKNLNRMYKKQFELLWNQEINSYKGNEGIKNAFENIVNELKPGEEVHIMGVYEFGKEFLPLALYFQKIRSEKGIKAKFLMNQNAKNIAKEFRKYPPLEIRFMEEGIFTPAIFIIYNDKVIINLAREKTFFVMQSKSAAQAYEQYFQLMWKTAKQ